MSLGTAAFSPPAVPATVNPATYRADVDGLRALAVIGVVIHHMAPALLPGGFAGVDVFFVISGFLISGIILRALEDESFSVSQFYARRIRRIFPALLILLMTVLIVCWPWFLWDEYQLLGKHVLAGAGFSLNLVLYDEHNLYFGMSTTPLLHLWSLGVEEQFYIVWPLLLIVLWRRCSMRTGMAVILAVIGVSMTLNIFALGKDATAAYYLPSSRMWELALGSLIAYAHQNGYPRWQLPDWLLRIWPDALASLGLALILISFTMLGSHFAYPGWWALLPCLGTVLLIAAGSDCMINRYFLGNPAVVFVGLISYPLYLWHWPLLSIGHIVGGAAFDLWWRTVAVVLAFALATLTYIYIELPIRSARRLIQPAIGLGAAMLVCATVGLLIHGQIIPARSQPNGVDRFIHASREDWKSPASTDWTWYSDSIQVGTGKQQTLFIGDSNMQQYFPRIAKVVTEQSLSERSAIFEVRAGCAPAMVGLLETNSKSIAGCRGFLQRALSKALTPNVDTVVIAALWPLYFVSGWSPDTPGSFKPGSERALAELSELIQGLVARGKSVYVVLSIPVSSKFNPREMIQRTVFPPALQIDIDEVRRADVERVIEPIIRKLRQVAEEAGARTIDPMASLCDDQLCRSITSDGEPMYRDSVHLRPSYARNNVYFLDQTLLGSNAHRDARVREEVQNTGVRAHVAGQGGMSSSRQCDELVSDAGC